MANLHETEELFDNLSDHDLRKATQYMLENSPMKQLVENGKLQWKDCEETGTIARKVLLYVRRVRNNLFHGSKMATPWPKDRDVALLEHSMTVLNACLCANPGVKHKFAAILF